MAVLSAARRWGRCHSGVAGSCAGRERSGTAQLCAPPLGDRAVLSAAGSGTDVGRALAEQVGRDRAVGNVHRGPVAAGPVNRQPGGLNGNRHWERASARSRARGSRTNSRAGRAEAATNGR